MDPGLLSDSGAGRGLCPGNRPPASAPGRASRFFKRQPPHAPGIFPFYSQPGLCLRTRKKRYKTALCFPLLFSIHGTFPSQRSSRPGSRTARGLSGCPFLPFPVSQLHLRPPGSLPGQEKRTGPGKQPPAPGIPAVPGSVPDRRAGPDPSGDPEALMIRSILSQPSPALQRSG